MPLRDHFHPPLDDETAWEGFHGGWPMVIVQQLGKKLPARYVAAPRVHSGFQVEIDVATYDTESEEGFSAATNGENGGVATAVWAPAQPTLAVESELPDSDEYEVRVYDTKRSRRLVAAVEIVSPSNKDRPEHRRIFVAKCAALLRQHVSVAIIDLVTVRDFNLYGDLLELLGLSDPALGTEPPALYAVACRWRTQDDTRLLEAWNHPLALGQPLPTLPLWLANTFAVPLELEESYEQTCRDLRIT
jgi:Protein of unknown function (DUF4058)